MTVDTGDRKLSFRVELALTPAEQERGLMFRQSLGADEGMLFVFDRQFVHTFWMKNTLIPLDMLFIDSDRRIVGIVENAEPQTLSGRSVGLPSQYVLEIGGGLSASSGSARGRSSSSRVSRRPDRAPPAMQPMLAMLADAPLSDPTSSTSRSTTASAR